MIDREQLDSVIRHVNQQSEPKILELDLHNQGINHRAIDSLVAALSELPQLSELNLDLEANQINSDDAQKLITYISEQQQQLAKLSINFRNNLLGNQGAQIWADYLTSEHCPQNVTLSLAFNNIRREGAFALAAAFTAQNCCPSLAIDLRSNNFLFSGTKAIRDAYKSEQSPKHFILHCEKINEQPEKSTQSSAHDLSFFRQYPDAPRAEDSAYIRGVWPRPST